MPRLLRSAFAMLTIAGLSTTVMVSGQTQSAISNWWQGEYASGDWGGHRAKLEASGVHPWLNYEQDLAGNPSGGVDQGITNSGSIEAGVLLDLGKLANWDNSTLLVRFIDRNGSDLSGKYTGNFFPIQQDFGVETLMLQSIALEHTFADTGLALKFGRVAMGDDFAGSPVYGLYMSNAIDGTPKALTTTSAFSCYPGSVWGARLQYTAPDQSWYGKFGVYQANDRLYTGDKHGFQFDIRHNDGVTLVSEFGWNPVFNQTGGDSSSGLPGHYWAGAYASFWDIPRIDGRGVEDFSYAFYFHADQTVWKEQRTGNTSGQDLSLWAVLSLAPKQSIQVMPWQISGGLAWSGPLSQRPADQVVLGVSYGDFSDDYATQQAPLRNGERPTGETVVELAYIAQLNRFTTLQPDIQYIVRPAGVGNIDNILALGIRLKVTF